MKIVWSPLALKRVGDIAAYIAEDNPAAARQWVEGVFASVRNLSLFPESGRLVPEVRRQNFREIVMGNYRLIYRIKNQEISVLTVRHFKQMLPIGEINEPAAAVWG
jgi:toxin ParE1/3/4